MVEFCEKFQQIYYVNKLFIRMISLQSIVLLLWALTSLAIVNEPFRL